MQRVLMPGQLQTFLDEEDEQATADTTTTTTAAEPDATTAETRVQTRASKKTAAVPGSSILRQLPDDLKRKIVAMAIHPWSPGIKEMPSGEVLQIFITSRNTCGALLATRKRSEPAQRAMRLHMYRHTFCIWQMQARVQLLMQHLPRNTDLLKQSQKQDNEQYAIVCALAGKNPEMWRAALQTLKDKK